MERTSVSSFSPLLLLLLFATLSIVAGEFRRVCYYTNWSQYRKGVGKFLPRNIDPQLCTHICFAFAKIVNHKLKSVEWNDENSPWKKGLYEEVNNLKKNNSQLKTLLSVGGWGMGSQQFTAMVANESTRKVFIADAIIFLRNRSFDGLDIDWEYPGSRGSNPSDKQRYVQLLQECHQAFEEESKRTGKPRLLLIAAVPAGKATIDAGYDIKSLHPYVDFLNVMTYDYHGTWESMTGHNSPFRASTNETGNSRHLNMVWTMRYWKEQGVPVSKLNLGLPFYGRSFTLKDPAINGLMAPTTSGGAAGSYTGEMGVLAYYEICQLIHNGATVRRLSDQKVPYLVVGDQWVGYDDPTSLYVKVSWAKQSNLGGIFVWAIDLDDFSGTCPGNERNILMKTIIRAINDQPPIIPSTFKTLSRRLPATTQASSTANFCVNKTNGVYQYPERCGHFFQCFRRVTYVHSCPPGTVFNPQINTCDHRTNVPGCKDGD